MATMSVGNVWFEKTGQAPSPSKDFHQLIVNDSDVIWRCWRISLRKEQGAIAPSQNKQSHKDFYFDEVVSADIKRVFGNDVLRYVECIVNKDWLLRMENDILLQIFSYLDLKELENIAQVCRHFAVLCNSNQMWRMIYKNSCPNLSESIVNLGNSQGWKKLFFTNKLQQQKEASRFRRSVESKKKDNINTASLLVVSY